MATDEEVYTAIQIEKRLCAALGREWRPAGISVESLANEAADEIGRLRAALEPFAGLYIYPDAPDDGLVIVANTAGGIIDTGKNRVTVGDLRRAALALEQNTQPTED
jgi:hypothetical protein